MKKIKLAQVEQLLKSRKYDIDQIMKLAAVVEDPKVSPEEKARAKEALTALANADNRQSSKKSKSDNYTKSFQKETFQPKEMSQKDIERQSLMSDIDSALNQGSNKSLQQAKINQIVDKAKIDKEGQKDKKERAEKRQQQAAHERIYGREAYHSHGIDLDTWKTMHPETKKFFEEKEPEDKKAEREQWNYDNKVLPGEQWSRAERAKYADKINKDPNAPKGVTNKDILGQKKAEPTKVSQIAQQRTKSNVIEDLDKINKIYDQSHSKDGNGNYIFNPQERDVFLNRAHLALSHLHKEGDLPNNLKDYHPDYVHFEVSPRHWVHSDADEQFKNNVKNFHQEVLSGTHDESADPFNQNAVKKLKSIHSSKEQSTPPSSENAPYQKPTLPKTKQEG
jgi:hypothetical protein